MAINIHLSIAYAGNNFRSNEQIVMTFFIPEIPIKILRHTTSMVNSGQHWHFTWGATHFHTHLKLYLQI